MDWQPQKEPLQQLAGYLKDALSGHDQRAQKYATMVSSVKSLAVRTIELNFGAM